jgi:hypothetical protein
MMSCNEATLGPDGQIEKLNCEGTTLLTSAANTDENGAVAVRKQDSAQNNKTHSLKENHVCTICKFFGESYDNWQISFNFFNSSFSCMLSLWIQHIKTSNPLSNISLLVFILILMTIQMCVYSSLTVDITE